MATKYPQFETTADVKDLDIDRNQCQRTVPMQVLSLGMSRTGTASMKVALHILGYSDVYHFLSMVSNIRDGDIWTSLLKAKYSDQADAVDWRSKFDGVLGHCAAVTDMPAVHFGPELILAYPEAKVVLVERDIESWVRSYTPIAQQAYFGKFDILSYLDPVYMARIRSVFYAAARGFWKANSNEELLDNLRPKYREHYQSIRDVVPRDRLLEYRLGSGWEPLCEFLGKEVPDVPFPRVNESDALQDWIKVMTRRGSVNALKNLARLGSTAVVLVVALYMGWRRWL